MVDPHQVLIDNNNGNNASTISDTLNFPADFMQMSDCDPSEYQNQQRPDVQSVVCADFNEHLVNEDRQNVYNIQDDSKDIMCGPSARSPTSSTIQINDNNSANAFVVAQNGNSSSLTSNNLTRVIADNQVTSESNDLRYKTATTSTSVNSAADNTLQYSAEYPNAVTALDKQIGATVSTSSIIMDSRKVEPLRININRDPIKTKIKLAPPGDRQNMSPKSSSSSNTGIDDCDDGSDALHENQQTFPKITIKPIVKPPMENEHQHINSSGLYMPSSSQEAIPKLKIKKVDPNNSSSNLMPMPASHNEITGNYQTQLLSESNIVPKLTTNRSSTTNLSIGSNSDGNCTASSEGVPKVTIKLDNHGQHMLKPMADPPLRLTITNAFNDTAKVVMLNNSEQTDESSDELPSQPPSNHPSPNDKNSTRTEYATHAITSTSTSYSLPNAEDNLSTCSSGSSSSYSSNASSITDPNNDIKLIIKATSTGNCVLSPNSSTISRNSPSSVKSLNNLKASNNSITSNLVTSSTLNVSDQTPVKLNIKLSNTDYPQVIHNEVEQNIVIPKVTIKPVVNPNENSDANAEAHTQLVTPKIILKSIPKPIEKPLEINTGGQGSPFRNSENESQQSPRIILKINKNAMSQTKESSTLTSTTIIAEEPLKRIDSPQPAKINELKRPNYDSEIQPKKQKLAADVVQLLSSDSEMEEELESNTNNNHNELDQHEAPFETEQDNQEPVDSMPANTFDSNSGLRSILSRPQMKIQPQPLQNFLQTLPPFKSTSDINPKTNDVIDLCHDSNDHIIGVPLDEESTSTSVTETNNDNSDSKQNSSNAEQNKKSNYNWKYFYGETEKGPVEPVHPLLQQNIERANVLAAMMEASNNQDRINNRSNNNNTAKADEFEQSTSKNSLLDNDGSSSDCIVIEDTGSEPFSNDFVSADNSADQNGKKKESVDRDSGVDVSNSVKSVNEEEVAPIVKRPRGRPRKGTTAPAGTTPKVPAKKPVKTPTSKRKFASIQAQQIQPNENATGNSFSASDLATTESIETQSTILQCVDNINNTSSFQQRGIESNASNTTPTAMDVDGDTNVIKTSLHGQAEANIEIKSPTALSPLSGHTSTKKPGLLTTPITPSVPKERKRRVIIDDDDESPTFNPLRSTKKQRGKGRQKRQSLLLKKQQKAQLLSPSDKTNESALFTSPEGIERRKVQILKDTSAAPLQVFEEDTRMSADSLFASPSIRTTEFLQNDESQSSLHSSTSATVESSAKKIRSKIEVVDPEGRTEFTVDMIAEYDWPPPKGCCPSRNRDTFMIQEQIAEYLGVKSFKRKYPDLPRRMVEMEERNYLMEKQLVSEKMCDLGLTAVLASDILDIMNNDFFEKYEEYRRYLREKQIRDLAARQKQMQAGILGKSLGARENAMRAASMWNTDFNRSRKDRRECLDLQNFVIQIPDAHHKERNRPSTKPSNYPVALVPGQFQEYYRKFSPAELLCYPLNTVLADPQQLDRKLREYYDKMQRSHYNSDDDSGSESDSSCSSGSDSDDSDSSDDSSSSSDDEIEEVKGVKEEMEEKVNADESANENKRVIAKIDKSDRQKCQVCSGPERCNQQNKPEIFVGCTICKGNAHPTCLKMSSRMVRRVNEYAWQCRKCTSCIKCKRSDNEDKMLFCDQCDRSYHIYCIGLRKIPNGKWHCTVCTVCTLCGARRPEGHNNPNLTLQQKQKLLAVAKWTHEYQENPVTGEQEHVSMLCTSCMAIKHSAAKNAYFN